MNPETETPLRATEEAKRMQEKKEQIEEIKEHEPKEIQRLKLDPEKGMDIVIRERKGEKVITKEVSREPYELSPARVVIEKDGEIIEDFGERLPNAIYFDKEKENRRWENRRWEIGKDTPQVRHVVVMPAEWKGPENILSFIHEIGHIRHFNKDREFRERLDEFTEKAELKLKKESMSMNMLKELCTKNKKLSAQGERGAWAEGLRLARELKRDKDIDLLKPFRKKKANKLNWKKLNKHIDQISLGSYEKDLRVFTKAGLVSEDLRGIFTKRYKENFINKIKIFIRKTILESIGKRMEKMREREQK